MPKRYPPLTYSEVISILMLRGFEKKAQRGSHEQYEGTIGGRIRKVTVDQHNSPFDDFLIKSMIEQSGMTREEFYSATNKTAKKINLRKS